MNGWKNYQTWSCSLWLSNDTGLYESIMIYHRIKDPKRERGLYNRFIKWADLVGVKNGDGISFSSSRVSRKEMNKFLMEFRNYARFGGER
jgi:hypothetical protein